MESRGWVNAADFIAAIDDRESARYERLPQRTGVAIRRCAECTNRLPIDANPRRRTCSDACRVRRNRHLRLLRSVHAKPTS